MPGTLYLVATPIGNLKDISQRAIETLQAVDLIACEDTRHSAKLVNAYGISKKLVSYHEHNEVLRSDELIARLESGDSIALISDAGTPLINDPGYTIVQKALENGIPVVSIPGPVAFVNAAVVSGLPTDQIFFGGFLPSKKGERRKYLESVSAIPSTLAFYESPHRLGKSLTDCFEVLGDRRAAVVRELTKLHEQVVSGTLLELAHRYSNEAAKGEIVLVIAKDERKEPLGTKQGTLSERVIELEAKGVDRKTALKTAAKEFGVSRSEAYRSTQIKEQK
jgi:16S rRNA (cytidine1402-2'-O)-methyltransferase